MKYMVMECHPGYAVLLDEEGRFVKAANFHYQVGETVENPVLMKMPEPEKKRRFSVVIGMAAAAACLLLAFTGGYYQTYVRVDTAVYLTINPSVCMELNYKGNVVRLNGMNEDGRQLLKDYQRSSNDRLVVMDELIDRAIDMDFLSEGGTVTVDIDAPSSVRYQQYDEEFRTNLADHLGDRMTVEIKIKEHSSEEDELPASEENPTGSEVMQDSGYGVSAYEPEEDEEEEISEEDEAEEEPEDEPEEEAEEEPEEEPQEESEEQSETSDEEIRELQESEDEAEEEPEDEPEEESEEEASDDEDSDDE